MRISAGKKKGAKLKSPKSKNIRPTTSIVKEYIFGFLGDFIKGKRVLDLFAGTGNLGIEAISRGAASVSFVDIFQQSIYLIKDNLKKTGFENRSKIYKTDVFDFISKSYRDNIKFDIVLSDPPFKYKELFKLCESEKLHGIIENGSYFIIEHYPEINSYYSGFMLIKFRSFGGNKISIFKKVGKIENGGLSRDI
ncbi:16S rRNA (guanine(966)-N(2))-methyltransferase RsmD [candidate division KSB1 bacterium]